MQFQKKPDSSKIEGKYKLVRKDRNYIKLTGILIENGLAIDRIDSQGQTVLYKEVEREHYDTVDFLIDSGADINTQDNDGRTVIFDAVLKGPANMNMIDHLLSRGADIDHRDFEERTVIDEIVEAILITQNGKKPRSRRYFELKIEENYICFTKKRCFYSNLE